MAYRLGVDVGGTFTDFLLMNERGVDDDDAPAFLDLLPVESPIITALMFS